MKRIQILAMLAISCSSYLVLADGETHVGGAGKTVDIKGRPSLIDLVDNTVCIPESGEGLMNSLQHFPKALDAIRKVSPVFADRIVEIAQYLNICLTRNLKQIPTEDQEGLTIYFEPKSTRQVAIRLNNVVYIDENIRRRMRHIDQTYLYLHEIGHDFIPMDTKRRNHKLRSLVAALKENEKKNLRRDQLLALFAITSAEVSLYRDDDRLLGAVVSGDEALVRQLIENDVDPNSTFQYFLAPEIKETEDFPILAIAAAEGQVGIVRYLLEHPDIHVGQMTGSAADNVTAVHFAALRGHAEIVRMILAKSENLPIFITTLLPYSVGDPTGESTRAVLADPRMSAFVNLEMLGEGAIRVFPLCLAAFTANVEAVRALLEVPGVNTSLVCVPIYPRMSMEFRSDSYNEDVLQGLYPRRLADIRRRIIANLKYPQGYSHYRDASLLETLDGYIREVQYLSMDAQNPDKSYHLKLLNKFRTIREMIVAHDK